MGASVAAPLEAAARRPRAVYTRLATMGLVLAAATPVFILVAGLFAGQALTGEDLTFFGVTALIGLAGAVAVWYLGLAGRIVGIVASLLLGMALFWTMFGLAVPAAFADFIAGVMLPVGVILGVGGGIASIVAARRGQVQPHAGHLETRIMLGALGVLAVAVIASGIASVTGRTVVSEAAAAGATQLGMADMQFSAPLEVTAGEPARVVVHNSDAFLHDFAIPALGLEPVQVLPGSDQLIELSAPVGTYTVYCTLHADLDEADPAQAGMATTLVAR